MTQKIYSSLTFKLRKIKPLLSLPPRYTLEMAYKSGTFFVRVPIFHWFLASKPLADWDGGWIYWGVYGLGIFGGLHLLGLGSGSSGGLTRLWFKIYNNDTKIKSYFAVNIVHIILYLCFCLVIYYLMCCLNFIYPFINFNIM